MPIKLGPSSRPATSAPTTWGISTLFVSIDKVLVTKRIMATSKIKR